MDHSSAARRNFLKTAGAVALASSLPTRAGAEENAPLRFGFQNTSWGTIGMIAESEKLFEKVHANVKIFHFGDGKTARDAMIAGRMDMCVLGGTPFIVGAAKSDIGAIGTALYAGKTNAVVAGKASGIKTIADLKGKRVASQLGSSTDYVFQNKILPKYGLTRNDVHIIDVTFQNHVAALVGKSADAFAGVEPFPSVAEVEGLGTVLLDYAEFDIQPVFLAVNEPLVKNRHAALVGFMRGWLEAVRIVKEEPDRAVRIVWDQFKKQGYDTPEAVFKRMLGTLDVRPDYVPNLNAYLDQQAQVLLKQKKISKVPDWARILDTTVLAQARKA